jgi:hypothetical protein
MEGEIAGLAAAGKVKEAEKIARRRLRKLGFVRALRAATALNPQLKSLATDATIVCRCEDVGLGRLRHYASWREAKLQTRCGMGPCQGRICGPATEILLGWDGDLVYSSMRLPVFPALVSSLGVRAPNSSPADNLIAAGASTPREKQ